MSAGWRKGNDVKVTCKGSVYQSSVHVDRFEFWPVDGSHGGFEHLGVFVQSCTVEFEVRDDFDGRKAMCAKLEQEKKRIAAEYQKRVTEIDAQIQSLLAIEA